MCPEHPHIVLPTFSLRRKGIPHETSPRTQTSRAPHGFRLDGGALGDRPRRHRVCVRRANHLQRDPHARIRDADGAWLPQHVDPRRGNGQRQRHRESRLARCASDLLWSKCAPENTFIRTATGVLPGGASFTRADVQIANLATSAVGNVVAESLLNGVGPASETGNSALTATFSFTPTATSLLSVGYHYANDIYVVTTGSGAASASYNFDFTIKDAAGNVVFLYGSSPLSANTNLTLSAPPQGGEIIKSGNDVVSTAVLTAGQAYTLIFTEKTATSVALAVPEPGSMTLAAVAGGLMIVTGAVRRFRRPSKSA